MQNNRPARYAFRQNDWNHYRVRAQGDSIQTWINGVPAADLTDDMTSEGFIALQVHGVGGRKDPISVQWRNIRLRELSPDGADAEAQATVNAEAVASAAADIRKIGEGFGFAEGPAMGPDGNIYFSDIPNARIHKLDVATGEISVYRSDSGGANGLVWTPNDALMACEGGARRVSRQELGGEAVTIVDKYDGKKLNSPQ